MTVEESQKEWDDLNSRYGPFCIIPLTYRHLPGALSELWTGITGTGGQVVSTATGTASVDKNFEQNAQRRKIQFDQLSSGHQAGGNNLTSGNPDLADSNSQAAMQGIIAAGQAVEWVAGPSETSGGVKSTVHTSEEAVGESGVGGSGGSSAPIRENAQPPVVPKSTPAAPTAPVKPSGFEPYGFNPPPGTRQIPQGIPVGWRIRSTQGEGGVWYYDPTNKGNAVRVMPGDAASPFPNSQAPYVRWQRNGQPLDVNGNALPTKKTPESHIPLQNFRFDPGLFK